MKTTSILILVALAALPLVAGSAEALKVTPAGNGRIDVIADKASLFAAVEAVGMKLSTPVTVDLQFDSPLTIRLENVTAREALRRIADVMKLEAVTEDGQLVLRDPKEPRVTLDVEDEDARLILEALKGQCGIRNLMVDPQVSGKGTFLLREVPCGVAIRTVLESLSLDGRMEPNSVLRVTPKQ